MIQYLFLKKMGSSNQVKILDVCASLCANALKKFMNLSILRLTG